MILSNIISPLLISSQDLVFQLVLLVSKPLSAAHARAVCCSLQVRVEGFNYVGMGNSTNKKDAQSNAARDFINYLVRVNEMKKDEIPAFGVSCSFSLPKTTLSLWCHALSCVSSLEFSLVPLCSDECEGLLALLEGWGPYRISWTHGII